LSLAGLVACSVDCEEARDKLLRCSGDSFPLRMPITIKEGCGSEGDQCRAECVDEHSCGAIEAVVSGDSGDPNDPPPEDTSDFQDCVMRCPD
jgi:hypothetical protein